MPSKIMKQILQEDMSKRREDREVIRDNQHGFTKGKSHLTNLVAFYNGVAVSVNKGRDKDVTYLDLCKAFDTVSYSILATKLRDMGLTDGLLDG
ncbi:rna-directed dna polymerase from mobile element jockey- hypothetical protein [Limosa lapponica baueri]|uniref:Rna-directed dna polymerase from mobile element jockey-like n=1 Tax=Limosa lapponica baueri TaxID=1758121 RepID=A0A2I0TJA4_LIMLA|nr:rna-directed dna polymerase from mobile element jockey- hypothetical protein [Limosa lapponica baueri]